MSDPLDLIADQRLRGQYDWAFDQLQKHSQKYGNDTKYVMESIKVSVLVGSIAHAFRSYRILQSQLAALSHHDLSALWQLEVTMPQLNFDALHEETERRAQVPTWYTTFKTSGVLEHSQSTIESHEVMLGDSLNLAFKAKCSCCGHVMTRVFERSLCALDEYICPKCFAPSALDHQTITDYFGGHMTGMSLGESLELQDKVFSIRSDFYMNPRGEDFTKIEQYMSDSRHRVLGTAIARYYFGPGKQR
jgi:hypothetical protein